MLLQGSCYCQKVQFTVSSQTPYPYMRCYCSICRKTAGGGGYAINIMAQADSMSIQGESYLKFHQAQVEDDENPGRMKISPGKRYFCGDCGSSLWVADPRWPQWLYPFASVIETPLPKPPELVHIMLDFAAPWVDIPQGARHRHFQRYPDESIADWHERHGLTDKA